MSRIVERFGRQPFEGSKLDAEEFGVSAHDLMRCESALSCLVEVHSQSS